MSDEMHYKYDPKLGYVACSAEEAWNSEEKSMELGPVYTPPEKKLLTDVGTRFDHLNDLFDYLNDGLLADLNNVLDKCVPERGVLEDIRKARIEALKTTDQKSLPTSPDGDSEPLGV